MYTLAVENSLTADLPSQGIKLILPLVGSGSGIQADDKQQHASKGLKCLWCQEYASGEGKTLLVQFLRCFEASVSLGPSTTVETKEEPDNRCFLYITAQVQHKWDAGQYWMMRGEKHAAHQRPSTLFLFVPLFCKILQHIISTAGFPEKERNHVEQNLVTWACRENYVLVARAIHVSH